ncbi:MAG TPA: N-acetylmuramoyl-L-alanine amidase [Oculatellaceae cyanobacterium]
MRFYWLLPSFLSIFLFSLPASAAKLLSWRFDANQNRLDFKTDFGVQPRAQLLTNPTRLIIDLPRTTLARPTVTQPLAGAIRSLRVGQFDNQTTRLVLELNPGYTIDPQEVLFRGTTTAQWSVKLPKPERIGDLPDLTPATNLPVSVDNNQSRPVPPTTISQQLGAQIQNLQVTRDGFFVRTNGGNPTLRVGRSEDRRTINIDLDGATLAPNLAREIPINSYGVSRIQFSQPSPRVARVTLNVSENSPDWQASLSRLDGIVLLPQGISAAQIPNPRPTPPNSNQLATIGSVELDYSSPQLLIRSDLPVKPISTWDGSARLYRITIPNAQLSSQIREPQLTPNSPLLRVRLLPVGSRTVEIQVIPSAGVEIGELNQISNQLVAVQLKQNRLGSSPITTIPIPPPVQNNPSVGLPSIPNSKIVVIVDPGHGGKDPGAIGYRGLREVDVILPIAKQVTALLEQRGIKVVMTRSADYFVDLAPRVDLAARVGADLFVSIHANSISKRPDVNGLETYYYGGGQRLAQTIHNSIRQSIDINNRGVRSARFYVLRRSSMPATLVEVGYLTSPQESQKLADPNYQRQMAEAIARGVLQYIQQNF